MKKIYTLMAGLILGGSIIGQNVLQTPVQARHKGVMAPNTKPIPNSRINSNGNSRTAAFGKWVEPVGDVMRAKQIDLNGLTSGTPSQGTFVDIIYQDSTVTLSDATGTFTVGDMMLGSVLDLKSMYIDSATLTPLVTNADPYYVDSIAIVGSYVKVTPTTDTLYTWVVWGDSSLTGPNPAFAKGSTGFFWVPPISSWRAEVIGPAVTGAAAGPGNLVKPTAAANHMVLVKYVLTNADSSSAGHLKVISIPLPNYLSIPAGSLVSCFYTFVPGSTNALGACSYSFTGGAPQTVNGFAGEVWGQTYPAVTAVANYQDQEVDPDGWNMGVDYYKNQRHKKYNNAQYEGIVKGDLVTGPRVFYFVSSAPTGVNELANNNFALLQNQPNPFTNQTTVNYQLKKSAANVAVEIYDVRGVKVYEKTEKNLKPGNYSLEVSDINFAAGLYFCTLSVDGQKVTNKMIKQ